MGSAVPVVHFGASEVRNVDALFFMLGWDRYRFHKKCTGRHYAELVFLHAVGSMCHVVHSCACRTRNLDVLFFLLGWTCSNFTKRTLGQVTPNLFFASGGINGSRSAF
jgi:hypothetical protein